MARVTVEDCIDKIDNRFELVMSASQRARSIGSGAPLMVDRDRDKNTVVSLREIAEEKVTFNDLQDALIRNYQRGLDSDDTDETEIEHMNSDMEWSQLTSDADSGEFATEEEDEGEEDFSDDSALSDLAGVSEEE